MLDVLRQSGFNIDMTKAVAGLEQTQLPGRMEMVHNDPRIMVDGAHNAASIAALLGVMSCCGGAGGAPT